jgi:hypothetical protein
MDTTDEKLTPAAPTVPTTPAGRAVRYPEDAVLTPDEVGAWINKPRAEVLRSPIPRIQESPRNVLYFAADVLDYLRAKRRAA